MAIDPTCLDHIKHKNPPIPCPSAFCASVQGPLEQHCHNLQLPPDTPVLLFDPNLGDKGGYCWCCCCDCAYDTPIEATAGQFVLAHDVRIADKLMAASLDPATRALRWQPATVDAVSDPGPGPMSNVCLVAYTHGADDSRALVVAADHLFLMDNATLKPAQLLAPGDRLRRADGGAAEVVFAVMGTSARGVCGVQLAGELDDSSLDGHLLNVNGVVCADLAVQLHHVANQLAANLMHASVAGAPQVGTPAYANQHRSATFEAMAAGPLTWPAGFTPQAGT
jgi:hypothetical protein